MLITVTISPFNKVYDPCVHIDKVVVVDTTDPVDYGRPAAYVQHLSDCNSVGLTFAHPYPSPVPFTL